MELLLGTHVKAFLRYARHTGFRTGGFPSLARRRQAEAARVERRSNAGAFLSSGVAPQSWGRVCRHCRVNRAQCPENAEVEGEVEGEVDGAENEADSPGDEARSSLGSSGSSSSRGPSSGPSRGPSSGKKPSSRSIFSRIGMTTRFFLAYAAAQLVVALWPSKKSPVPGYMPPAKYITVRLPFSDFLDSIKRDEVKYLAVEGNSKLRVRLSDQSKIYKSLGTSASLDKSTIWFETVKPRDYRLPYESLLAKGTRFAVVEKNTLAEVGNFLAMALVGFLVISWILTYQNSAYQGGSRPASILGLRGKGRKELKDVSSVTFDDVAGVDEAKEELQEIVEYLRDPERFLKLGARPPKGVLLVGPPGTGKTLLAKAVAGEAGVPFFSTSASEFVELYVGMGALRVRQLFQEARRASNGAAIVFIDEIDAVAKDREGGGKFKSSGNDEREQTLNQLLTELDGFNSDSGVVIFIAATNRPDVLDPALLRPGRFDRRVPVERPDRVGREQILTVHIENNGTIHATRSFIVSSPPHSSFLAPVLLPAGLPLDESFDLGALASQTTGFTGADLANIVNEAALLAGRDGKLKVDAGDFDAAVMRTVAGIEKKRQILVGLEKSVVAFHEIGHAIVASAVRKVVPMSNPVVRISIIPRSGGALGFTYSPPVVEDRALAFKNELLGQLAVLMGGRAAEALTSDSVSTGASDDIDKATQLARSLVSTYGMDPSVGPVNVQRLGESYMNDGETSQLAESQIRSMCAEAYEIAKDVLECNLPLLNEMSQKLVASERLDGKELSVLLDRVRVSESLRTWVKL